MLPNNGFELTKPVQAMELRSSTQCWADQTLMERMHRFVTFMGGAAPGPPLGPMSDPNCVIHGLALRRRTRVAFLPIHGPPPSYCLAIITVSSGGSRELDPPP